MITAFRIPYSVFRIPYSVFRIPYSVFRIPYSVFRILCVDKCEWQTQMVENTPSHECHLAMLELSTGPRVEQLHGLRDFLLREVPAPDAACLVNLRLS